MSDKSKIEIIGNHLIVDDWIAFVVDRISLYEFDIGNGTKAVKIADLRTGDVVIVRGWTIRSVLQLAYYERSINA